MRFETDEPHAVAVARDGEHWFATVAHGQPSFWKFESEGDRLVGRVDLPSGGAAMIALHPDGTTAYVPDYDRAGGRVGRVARVRLHDLVVLAHAPVCDAPHEAAVHPDGELVAVACSDEIVLVHARSLAVRSRTPAPAHRPPSDSPTHGHTRGARPMSLVWSRDGSRLAVALHANNAIRILDLEGRVLGDVPVGAAPSSLARTGDDVVVSANRLDGSLSIVNMESLEELRRIELDAPYPHGVATDGDDHAFVAYEGTLESPGGVIALRLENGAIVWRTEAGRYVLGIAYRER
jgi:DNA-binding beta-propeller fold protein YncE